MLLSVRTEEIVHLILALFQGEYYTCRSKQIVVDKFLPKKKV